MFQVYGQITLTFRYGREDEEVMGLKFCNEAVMCLAQLYPPYSGADQQETTPLQVCIKIIKRLSLFPRFTSSHFASVSRDGRIKFRKSERFNERNPAGWDWTQGCS